MPPVSFELHSTVAAFAPQPLAWRAHSGRGRQGSNTDRNTNTNTNTNTYTSTNTDTNMLLHLLHGELILRSELLVACYVQYNHMLTIDASCIKLRELRRFGNDTSNHGNLILKSLSDTNCILEPEKNHLRNYFQQQRGFSTNATHKNAIYSKPTVA